MDQTAANGAVMKPGSSCAPLRSLHNAAICRRTLTSAIGRQKNASREVALRPRNGSTQGLQSARLAAVECRGPKRGGFQALEIATAVLIGSSEQSLR
jgi:hypothetical protein